MAKKINKIKKFNIQLEVAEIKTVSKFYKKAKETKQMLSVTLKDSGKGDMYSITVSAPEEDHPLNYLNPLNDIGLDANLVLSIGNNPQKTLDDVEEEE
ncbi:hypothetical protein LCGC14_2563000 [marine sediment metagenome]|uniref:Uncharacterized protein n=1 Tax=marine sediment metagenome TaxID=412755 RepID=A0A0F9AJF1_9ZZZZ